MMPHPHAGVTRENGLTLRTSEETRNHPWRCYRRWCASLAGVLVALAVAVPAQADPTLYVASSGGGKIFQYGLDIDGSLSPLAEPTAAAGQSPDSVAVSANGRWVYVAIRGAVAQYDVSSDGGLSPMTPATVPAGQTPVGVAVIPDSNSVYVADAGGTIFQYDVGDDGALSSKTPATITSVPKPAGLAVSPDGRSVYVANDGTEAQNTALVYQFNVGAGEALSPKTPASVAADDGPSGVAVSPDGKSVYVTNSVVDTVSQYDVGAGGALSPKSAGEVGAGDTPSALAILPDGDSAYVANSGDGSVSQFNVGTGGALAPKQPNSVSAGSSPADVAVSPDGESVYATDSGGGRVYQFDVGLQERLSAKDPAYVTSGAAPSGLAVRPSYATTTTTFNFTGGVQNWVVPGGTSSGTFDLYGAEGGSSYPLTKTGTDPAPGGEGAHVEATLALTPATTLEIRVGGMGISGAQWTQNGPHNGNGGFN